LKTAKEFLQKESLGEVFFVLFSDHDLTVYRRAASGIFI